MGSSSGTGITSASGNSDMRVGRDPGKLSGGPEAAEGATEGQHRTQQSWDSSAAPSPWPRVSLLGLPWQSTAPGGFKQRKRSESQL